LGDVNDSGRAGTKCTVVCDSETDIQGACLASVQSIVYANKPGKRERLKLPGRPPLSIASQT